MKTRAEIRNLLRCYRIDPKQYRLVVNRYGDAEAQWWLQQDYEFRQLILDGIYDEMESRDREALVSFAGGR